MAANLFVLALCRSDETISGYADRDAVFSLLGIEGIPFAADATLSFPEPGRVSGAGPCNDFAASQSAPYPWFDPGAIRATKRVCPDLPSERTYLDALARATIVEVSGSTLILTNETGLQMVFQTAN